MKVNKFLFMCDAHVPAENIIVDGERVFRLEGKFEDLMSRKVRSFTINFLSREISVYTKEGEKNTDETTK